MKKILKNSLIAGFTLLMGASVVSCTDENGFGYEGEGTLKMRLVLNSDVTRAELDQSSLSESCVVYISSTKGLIHKYQGLGNVPSEIAMKSGNYVLEAWAGDSVTASFDKKFYRGYQPFEITNGNVANVMLTCKIANVVACVNAESIDDSMISDYTITVGNTRGSLDFTSENVNTDLGYFMQPNGDSNLTWRISGKDASGADFVKEGVIENVQSAHLYKLNVKYGSADEYALIGGAAITIEVDDSEIVIEDSVTLHSGPKFKGLGFDLANPVSAEAGKFGDVKISTAIFGAASNYMLQFSDKDAFGVQYADYDIVNAAADVKSALTSAGLEVVETPGEEVTTSVITLRAAMLNRLPEGTYSLKVKIITTEGLTGECILNIKVTDAPIQVADKIADENITLTTVDIPLTILKDNAVNPAIEYRAVGDTEWIHVEAPATRSSVIVFRLTNLVPNKEYEYRCVCDNFEDVAIYRFKTKTLSIPNGGFEYWSTSGKVIIPSADGQVTFWDSGNHGTSTLNRNVTDKATDIKHSGNYSLKMASDYIVVKFAAGNVFIGQFQSLSGTSGAVLDFGREFDFQGVKPKGIRGWAHYRPVAVTSENTSATNVPLRKGDMDNGQIFAALATSSQRLDTANGVYFNPEDESILDYGEITWTDNFGPDGGMAEFYIEFKKNDKCSNYNVMPTHLYFTASSSKYGDYFVGGKGSVLYLDDLEFVYE